MTERWDLNWLPAYGGAPVTGDFRSEPEDFVVDEMAMPPSADSGEHVYLLVRKRGANTGWVAAQLASYAGVRTSDVGFYGLKDRHAVTTQWFSVWLAQKPSPDWTTFQCEGVEILESRPGPRKLRRGEHIGNRFQIRLRNISGDKAAADQVLAQLHNGVPNYFGEQRFGREGGNLTLAMGIAEEGVRCRKNERSFAMSAARSWLFNQVLAARVSQGTWREPVAGEPQAEPTGPLWGRGRNPASDTLGELESAVLSPWQPLCDWLEHCGLSQERRPLVLNPEGLEFDWSENDLHLSFALPAGAFATSVLREVVKLVNVSSPAIK